MPAKDHPVLDKAFQYVITGLNFQQSLSNEFESYIDLTLQRGEEIRRLRFLSPIDLELKHDFTSYGLCILDVSDRRVKESVGVDNFEDGSIKFFARKVVDLDKVTDKDLEILHIGFLYNLND